MLKALVTKVMKVGDQTGVDGKAGMSLADVADAGHFRHDLLPPGTQPELAATRHFAPSAPFCIAMSMILQILAAWVSETDPPSTVKS